MRAIGNVYGLSALGAALGPFVGGGLTELIDWRAVLFVNVPITLLAGLLVLRAVSESRDETVPRNIDLPGLLLVALGIAAVTFAVDRAADWGWLSPDTLGLIAAGLALLALFVLRERAARYPLVDLSLFRNRPYVGVTLLGAVANVSFVCATFGGTLYLQDVRGLHARRGRGHLPRRVDPPGAGGTVLRPHRRALRHPPLDGRRLAASGRRAWCCSRPGRAWRASLAAFVLFGGGYGFGWSMASVGTQVTVPPSGPGWRRGSRWRSLIGLGGLAIATLSTLTVAGAGSAANLGSALETAFLAIGIGSVLVAAAVLPIAHEKRAARGRGEPEATSD